MSASLPRRATPSEMRRWRCFDGFAVVATKTLAGDKGYCLGDFPQRVVDLGIKPHLAVPDNAPAHSPARRFVRSKGYEVSQVIRKRVEEIFGWGKSVAGLRRTKMQRLREPEGLGAPRAPGPSLLTTTRPLTPRNLAQKPPSSAAC